MTHYAVATMKKAKINNVPGMLRHDFRESDHHKNQDIDVRKSEQNYELVADHKLHKQDIMNYIEQHKSSNRKTRSDAVVMDEWIISSDHEYFESLKPDEVRGYFENAVDYFGSKFGRENIQYANVHMDESTPHMHMGIIPMTTDGKLSSKQVFNRNALRQIQSEFPKYMQEHGYQVHRGSEKSKRKKLSVDEYKHVQDQIKSAKHAIVHELAEAGVKDGDKPLKDNPDLEKKFEKFPFADLIKLVLQFISRQLQKIRERKAELEKREQKVKSREGDLFIRNDRVTFSEDALKKLVDKLNEPLPFTPDRDIAQMNWHKYREQPINDFVKTIKQYDNSAKELMGKTVQQSRQEINQFPSQGKER